MIPTHFTGKTICVTGAAGSIGSEICRRLASYGAKELRLVSLTEAGLYNIERELVAAKGEGTIVVPILGSVCDEDHMNNVLRGVDYAIHAAAHKHVPLCEKNPVAAIQTNVGGTEALARAAIRNSVSQFILISSDKAVKPASIMGATKRVAELLVRYWSARSEKTKFTTVRFGNVLDSAGSVLPLWREQIAKGLPITLTDERCERYFMSIPEAVDLVLGAMTLKQPSGLFVLDMGAPRKLIDMARELTDDSHIRIVGLRPGEKLTEELSYGGAVYPTEIPKVLHVIEPANETPVLATSFVDLLMAARLRNRYIAVTRLWELVG